MIEKLVGMYKKGGITGHHLVLECLHMIDPEHPDLVLLHLPEEVLREMLDFSREYQRGPLVTTHRILPAVDQVEAAKRWIETRTFTKAS